MSVVSLILLFPPKSNFFSPFLKYQTCSLLCCFQMKSTFPITFLFLRLGNNQFTAYTLSFLHFTNLHTIHIINKHWRNVKKKKKLTASYNYNHDLRNASLIFALAITNCTATTNGLCSSLYTVNVTVLIYYVHFVWFCLGCISVILQSWFWPENLE